MKIPFTRQQSVQSESPDAWETATAAERPAAPQMLTAPPTPEVKPPDLTINQSLLIGLGGVFLMISGVIAVFETDSEAGPVALLGLGLLFMLMGLVKRVPTKLEFGSTKIDLGEVQKLTEDLVEVTPVEEQQQLLERLNELNAAIPGAGATAIEGLFYQQTVINMIRKIVGDMEVHLDAGTRRWDVILTTPNGVRIIVDIVTSERRGTSFFRGIVAGFVFDRENVRADGILIIVRHPQRPAVLELISNEEDVSIVVVGGPDDEGLLRDAIHRAINRYQ